VIERDHHAGPVQERQVQREPHSVHVDALARQEEQPLPRVERRAAEQPAKAGPPAVGQFDFLAERHTAVDVPDQNGAHQKVFDRVS
jgi:hypothetical protein